MFVGLGNPICFASTCLIGRPRQDLAPGLPSCAPVDDAEITDEEAPNEEGESDPVEAATESQLDSSPPNDSLIFDEIPGEKLG